MSYWEPEDYEYEPNYPEVEEIIEEAGDKFKEFLYKQCKEQYDSIERQKELIDQIKVDLNKRESDLNIREGELDHRTNLLSKSEETQYETFKKRWFDSLGIGWTTGDRGYIYKIIEEKETCPVCKGKGKVEVEIEGKKYTTKCPKCEGYNPKITAGYSYEVKKVEICEIYYTVRKRRIPSEGDVVERLTYTYSNEPHTYMTVKIVSNNDVVFNESPETVYHTEEDCIKAAEDEVKKLKEKLKKE